MGNDKEKLLAALEKVLQISRDMVATTNLDELLGLIIARSMELLEAERATLFLYDPDSHEMITRVATGSERIRFSAEAGVAGAVAKSKRTLNIDDAYADGRFNVDMDRQTGLRTRTILAVPLLDYSGQLVGVLEVLNKHVGVFGAVDESLAETLAAQAGVMLQRSRLLEHYVEKQRMEQSLAIARQIQQDLLPRSNPKIKGFDVAGWSSPADETGGDVYDFFELGCGRWTLTLADATGHGIGPALVIAEARAMLRALSLEVCGLPVPSEQSPCELDISAVMAKVNNLLVADLAFSRFVTCLFAVLDAGADSLRYVSAGQGPLLFYDRANDRCQLLSATDLPLGVMEDVAYLAQAHRHLASGDMMVAVTDGFYEATDDRGEPFGMQRMQDIIQQCRDLPAAKIIEQLRSAVERFTRAGQQADDLTAIVVKKI